MAGEECGLYIHVPFCASICGYCHFARTDRHDAGLRRRVVDAVVGEFALRSERCATLRDGRRPLRTVYVGGGTPSVLEPELLAALLAGTAGRWPGAAVAETTVEANPESLDAAKARAWRAAGVDRVSLGVQSLDAGVLARLGRRATPADARRALDVACAVFPRVSADWIVGPGATREGLAAELEEAVGRGVGHVSLYILELHAGTPLARDVAAGRIRPPADAETAAVYLAAGERLERLGLSQYEVANFARPGQESRHNRSYWRRRPYLGLGPAAHGFWGRRRYANLADPEAYVAAVAAGRPPEASVDRLTPSAARLERLMLGLRTRDGVPLSELPPRALDLGAGAREGLWETADGRLRLTRRGFLVIDTVVERVASALAAAGGRPRGSGGPRPG